MTTIANNPKHRLLISLFFVFEATVVASFAGIMIEAFRSPISNPSLIFVLAFWISLLALLIVCFRLRRVARQLVTIGWTTALILVFVGLMIPKL